MWAYLRQNQLSLRVWATYEAIVDTCCRAWNGLMATPKRLASIHAATGTLTTPELQVSN